MKKHVIAAAALGLCGALLAAPVRSANEPEAPAADAPAAGTPAEIDAVARGRVILETNCARCHAIGMDDSSSHEEAPPFRVVVTRYPPETLAEALAEGIVSGHPDMPEFVFEPDEIEAILAYLGSLMQPGEPADEQAPAQE